MAREPVVAVDFLGLGTSMHEIETELKAEERGKFEKLTGSRLPLPEQSSTRGPAGDDEHETPRARLALGTDKSHASGSLTFSLAQAVPWASMAGKAEEMERCDLAVAAAEDKPVEELSDADIMQLSGDECRRYMMLIKKEREMPQPTSNTAASSGLATSKSWFRMETRNDEENIANKRGGSFMKSVLLDASSLSAQSGLALQHNVAGCPSISGVRNVLPAPWHSVQSRASLAEGVDVGGCPPERAVHSLGSNVSSLIPTCRSTGQNHLPGRPPTAQLTIFYSGTVNVYDGVPADKAQAIMLLAGSGSSWSASIMNPPRSVSVLPSTGGMASSSNSPAHSGPAPAVAGVSQAGPVTSPLVPTISVAAGLKTVAGRPTLHAELPQARKASLARFLEKRKDRVRGKAPYVPPIFALNKDVGSSTPPRENSPCPMNGKSSTRSPSPSNAGPRIIVVSRNRSSSPAQRPGPSQLNGTETSSSKTQLVALQQGPQPISSEDQASSSSAQRPSPEDLKDWRTQQHPHLSSQEQKLEALKEDLGSPTQHH